MRGGPSVRKERRRQATQAGLTQTYPFRQDKVVMDDPRWSVEKILGAVRDLPPEAQHEVLTRLPSVLSVDLEEPAWLRLAEMAFEFWDNPEDAVYDAL